MMDSRTHTFARPLVVEILIFTLATLLFLGGLGQKDIVTSHEARVAQTARAMAESGAPWRAQKRLVPRPVLMEENGQKRFRDSTDLININPWIVPVMNGQIRLNKPPLPYWCSAAAYRIFGVSEFSARFPTALLGALATLLMLRLGKMLFSRDVGLIAAMLWISSYFVVDEFRKSMSDPYLAFFTLLAVVACVRGNMWIIISYVALALGALSKGPVIFLTALPPMIILTDWARVRWSRWWWHGVGILIMLAISLPWVFAVIQQVPNAKELWRYDAFESLEKSRPFYLYLLNLFQLTLPWTPFWIAGVILPFLHRRRGARTRTRFAILIWAAFIIVCFSIKPVKKNAYLLPVMPALILMSAEAIAVLIRSARRFPTRPLPWTLMSICAAIGIGFACAIGGFAVKNYPSRTVGIVAAIIAILSSLPPLLEIMKGRAKRWFLAQSIAFGVIAVIFLSIWNATTENARSPRSIAAGVLTLSQRESLPIAIGPSPEELSFYLSSNLPDWRTADRVLLVLDKPTKLELEDHEFIQARFPHGMVTSWGIVLRDRRYVVVEVLVNRHMVRVMAIDSCNGLRIIQPELAISKFTRKHHIMRR